MTAGPARAKAWFFGISAAYFLGAAHLYMPSIGGDGLYVVFNAWGWIFASLVMALGLWQIFVRGETVFSRLQAWIWAGALLTLVPLAYPSFPFKLWATPRLLGLFGGLLFFFALYQFRTSREERFKLLYLVLGAVLIEAAIGLVQFYILSPDNQLGYDARANQPYGVFLQRNVMATFMATGIALAFWLLTQEPDLTPRKRWICYAVMPVASLLLVVCQSRVGQIGALLVAALAIPGLAHEHRDRLRWALALVALGLFFGWLSFGAATTRLGEPVGLRLPMWSVSTHLFAQSPWIGHGYGGFESSYIRAYAEAKEKDPSMPIVEENLDHPHNELLFWAVEGGIVPVIGVLIAAAAFLSMLRDMPWRRSLSLLALVAPMVLHTQTEFPFDLSMTHWLVFLLLVFVADHEANEVRSYPYGSKVLAAGGAVVIPVLVIPFMLTAMQANWLIVKYTRGQFKDNFLLLEVLNPIPILSQFEYNAYTLRLSSNANRDLQAYVDWGRRMNPRMPRAIVYINVALALHKMGKLDEAEATRLEGSRLYPHNAILNGTIPLGVARGVERAGPSAMPYMKKGYE